MKTDLKDLEIKFLHTVNELRKAYLLEKGVITVDHEELLYKILDFGPYDENCRDLANTLIEEMDDLKDYLQKSFLDFITLSDGEKLDYLSITFKEKLKEILDIARISDIARSTRDKSKKEEQEKLYKRIKWTSEERDKMMEINGATLGGFRVKELNDLAGFRIELPTSMMDWVKFIYKNS